MLDIHKNLRDTELPSYHEFLSRYNNKRRCIYGFVEGRDDFSYYYGAIAIAVENKLSIELWNARGKKNLLAIFNKIDWSRFPSSRILFFLDRDLSYFLYEEFPKGENIYITDNYSIENDLVSKEICDRLLTEIFGFVDVDRFEKDRVLDLFQNQLQIFKTFVVPIMAWIILCRRSQLPLQLSNLYLKDLFSVTAGNIRLIVSQQFILDGNFLPHDLNVRTHLKTNISNIVEEFKKANGENRFIRGKFLLWFLVKFINSIYDNANLFFSSLKTVPKKRIEISDKNAVTIIGPRANLPNSLKDFLKRTCVVSLPIENQSE